MKQLPNRFSGPPFALLASVVATALLAPHAIADGVVRDGLGAISGGRGGTNIAFADNGQVLLDNPAGMVNVAGGGLVELSADLLMTDLAYADPQNVNADASFRPMLLPQFSYVRKSDDGIWAYGIGAYSPAGFSANWAQEGPPLLPGQQRYFSFGALAKILPGVACKLTDRWSIGGTFGVAASHIELEGPFFLQTGALAGTPTVLDLQTTGAAITWSFGSQYIVNERTTVGIAYQSQTSFHMDGRARAVVPMLGGQSHFDADLSLKWPQSLGGGITHQLAPRHRVAADVIWFDWSGAFDNVGLRLNNPTNPVFLGALGATTTDRFPLNWDDSVSFRFGYEFLVNPCSTFRAGYAYHRNQIPESTLTSYIPAILEHATSIGWGYKWGCWQFDTAYQFSWGGDRTVGTSDVVGGDFHNSFVSSKAHWIYLSLLRRF